MPRLILIILSFVITKVYTILITNGTKVLLSSTNTLEVDQGCREIVIPNNFKKLNISLTSSNIDELVITDHQIKECENQTILSKCCSRNSTFCMENIKPQQSFFNLNYCIDQSYLYICRYSTPIPKNSTNTTTPEEDDITETTKDEHGVDNGQRILQVGTSSVVIATNVIKGLGCQTSEFQNDTVCSSLGMRNCRDQEMCLKICSYVECRLNNDKVFGMCVPSFYSNADIATRCSNHIAFNETNQPKIYREYCNKTVENQDHLVKSSSHTFFKFIAIVFGVLLLATFIASVYYRLKLGIDNEAPFDPPYFIPNFIFPRQTSNY